MLNMFYQMFILEQNGIDIIDLEINQKKENIDILVLIEQISQD